MKNAGIYDDILYHEVPEYPNHPRMSRENRAAQFAPFAALTGYDDMIVEEARIVDNKIELSEEEIDQLGQKLNLISDAIRAGSRPTVSVTRFVPDRNKAGGRYETFVEQVKNVDMLRQKLVLARTEGYGQSNVEIDLNDILEIRGELVDYMDNAIV